MDTKLPTVCDLPATQAIDCPHCGNKLAALPLYRHATHIATRKCRSRSCGTHWQVKATPMVYRPGMLLAELDWLELTNGGTNDC
jgi:transcription elongation factor Elf1